MASREVGDRRAFVPPESHASGVFVGLAIESLDGPNGLIAQTAQEQLGLHVLFAHKTGDFHAFRVKFVGENAEHERTDAFTALSFVDGEAEQSIETVSDLVEQIPDDRVALFDDDSFALGRFKAILEFVARPGVFKRLTFDSHNFVQIVFGNDPILQLTRIDNARSGEGSEIDRWTQGVDMHETLLGRVWIRRTIRPSFSGTRSPSLWVVSWVCSNRPSFGGE